MTKSFVSGANDLQIDFCNKYLRKMLEIGSLFIVFDSFDEVPAILDHPDTSDILRNISSVFDDFIAGPHNSRCIIASRYFRRPRLFSAHIAMLEILPFSPKKIRENLNKSSRLSLSEIDSFIASRSHWLDASKNPFVAQLVIDYISANRGKIPFSKIEVYDAYIRTRLSRLDDILTEYKMTTDGVIEVATQISFAMFSHTRIGLEASLDEILQWLKTYSAPHIRNVADILVRSRLMRKGPFPAEQLSFVHRRFNEYFLAKAAADGLMTIDLESIATDRRDRDALVLYVELAESEQVQRIIAFCWQQLSVTASEEAHATAEHIIENRLRATFSLRFLINAFSDSRDVIQSTISGPLHEYLCSLISDHESDMLSAKIAVEAVGILSDEEGSDIIRRALETGNSWVIETAIRASRNINSITPDAANSISKTVLTMPEAKILSQGSELMDVFRLNEQTARFARIVQFRRWAIMLQWPIRIIAMWEAWALYLVFVSLDLLFKGLQVLLSRGGAARPDYRRVIKKKMNILLNIVGSAVTSNYTGVDDVFWIPFAFFPLVIMWVAAIYLMSFVFMYSRTAERSLGVAYFETKEFDALANVPTIFHDIYAYFAPKGIVILLLAVVLSISVNRIAGCAYEVARVYRTRSERTSIFEGWTWLSLVMNIIRVAAVVSACFLLMVGILTVSHSTVTISVIIILYIVIGAYICWNIAIRSRRYYVKRRMCLATPVSKFSTRDGIEDSVSAAEFADLRMLLVKRIEEYHRSNGTTPSGKWKSRGIPNYGDKASVRLSELEERWIGLER